MTPIGNITDDEGELTFCLLKLARQLFDEDTAAKLRDVFGGRSICIPVREDGSSIIARVIGAERAKPIVERLAGLRVAVPTETARRRRETVKWLSLAGACTSTIARTAQCTERNVFTIRSALRSAGELPPAQNKGPLE